MPHAATASVIQHRDDPAASGGAGLEWEARAFARYLLGADPPVECIARYVAANRSRLEAPPTSEDAAILDLLRRRPRTLPYLDAATAVLRPGSMLRAKLLIAAAVLEASPHSAEALLPRRVAPAALLLGMARLGALVAFRLVVGVPLLLLATRGRRG